MALTFRSIFESIKGLLGEQVTALILSQLLTKENIIKGVDYILDFGEELAKKTDTTIDDTALKKIRETLNIPDNDEPAK